MWWHSAGLKLAVDLFLIVCYLFLSIYSIIVGRENTRLKAEIEWIKPQLGEALIIQERLSRRISEMETAKTVAGHRSIFPRMIEPARLISRVTLREYRGFGEWACAPRMDRPFKIAAIRIVKAGFSNAHRTMIIGGRGEAILDLNAIEPNVWIKIAVPVAPNRRLDLFSFPSWGGSDEVVIDVDCIVALEPRMP